MLRTSPYPMSTIAQTREFSFVNVSIDPVSHHARAVLHSPHEGRNIGAEATEMRTVP